MKDFITPSAVADAMASYFMPMLRGVEDLAAFERVLAQGSRSLAARCMGECIEAFDRGLVADRPRGWSVHSRERRTLLTMVGPVEFERTCFTDEFGRRRLLADELLGIAPRCSLSPGAFVWVVTAAAELSYRKTAAAFAEATGGSLSHVTVMNAVHREGELLKRLGREAEHVSCPELFLEVDGLWVHLQRPDHRDVALPRGIYEQARKTVSFELKMACLYAGKRRLPGGRVERVNLDVTCADAPAAEFWEAVWQMMCDDYDERDIERVCLGADGGSWCGPDALRELMGSGVEVGHFLDLFHLMQAVVRAFPEGAAREKARQMAFRGRASALSRACSKIASGLPEGPRRRKLRELASYAAGNAAAISADRPSMGTMEGTNGHVAAARVKGQGRSWSRRGAEAMVLVRCALACGRPLVAPARGPFFTQAEGAARDRALARSTASSVPESVGEGWEPPFSVRTLALPPNARHAALTGR